MADWSTTAILVDEDAVWIGLADRLEGADRSGGLLRYDRKSGGYEVRSLSNHRLH